MAKKNAALPTQTTWNVIVAIVGARDVVKAMLAATEGEIKDARRTIDELGVKNESSEDFRIASARLVRSLRERDLYKERIKTLAEKIDKAITDAAKGENELIETFDASQFTAKPTTDELYHDADHDPAQMELAGDGRPQHPKPRPEAEVPVGEDQHLLASINELDLSDAHKARLHKLAFRTVKQVADVFDDERKDPGEEFDAGEKIVAAIKKAVKSFRAKHRDAQLEEARA